MMPEPEDEDRELVMPFVVVQSQGGPYEDAAYVAGAEFGRLAFQMEAAQRLGLGLPHAVVHPENLAQLDLMAMKIGAHMVVKEWPEGTDPEAAAEWAWVDFEWTRPAPPPGEGPASHA